MTVDSATLHKMAHLARLNVQPDEETALLDALNGVLTWMEQLNAVDTEGVDPLAHMSAEVNTLRNDVAGDHLPRDVAFANAPAHNATLFQVPKVLE